MDIKKLINNNKWDKIYNLITDKKISPDIEIANGNTIAHLVAINNNSKIIHYLLNNNLDILEKGNDEGNTPIHLLATYGYTELLKDCIKKNPNFLILLNNNNENVCLILYDDIDFIKLMLKHYTSNIIVNDLSNENIITKNINDDNYEILKLLLPIMIDEINTYPDSFLCYAINENKNDIAKLFITNGYDVNKKDKKFMTPFLYTVVSKNNELMELLIKNHADIDYVGAEGDNNPLIYAIRKNDVDTVDLLIDHGFNPNNYNKFYETSLHIALINKKISPTILSKLLYYGDLNAQTVNGQTPLHLLCKYHNWKNYNKIIQRKKLNIFIQDKDKKRPIDYLTSKNLYEFIDTTVDSYIKTMIKKDGNIDLTKCNTDAKSEECKNEIKKYIFTTQRSIPKNKDLKVLNTKIKLITGSKPATYGLFNSDILHNMIYTIILMKKYKNIGIPFQYFISDKFINDKTLQVNNNLYKTTHENVIFELVNIYTNFFYEISPYLIVWKSSTQYYVNKNIEFYLKKCLLSNKIKYIILKLTLVVTDSNTHANIIIYDKINKTLERFEPYGKIPYTDTDKLNEFVKNLGIKYFGPDITYLSPEDLFGSLGFQTISGDNRPEIKNLNDPLGYCLSWTFWYLEMRISNPTIPQNTLISNTKDLIVQKYGNLGEKAFISFIRDYSADLDKYKNEFMISAGIGINEIYNLIQTDKNQTKIINMITSEFNKLVGEIY